MSGILRGAAILLAFSGVGFGIPAVLGIRSLLAGDGIATVFGFPAYGNGPFTRHGIESTPLLLGLFLAVCLLECVAAVLIWQGMRWGAILSVALLVPGAVFWWGFALPFGPVFAVARTILVAMGWKGLS
jgi:hypothetical protein